MSDPRKAISLPPAGRLRNVSARTLSGPEMLARRRRFAALHLRADRARYGEDGPGTRLRRRHLAAMMAALILMLAIAGAPF